MSLDVAGPPADRAFATTTWGRALVKATHFALALSGLAIVFRRSSWFRRGRRTS